MAAPTPAEVRSHAMKLAEELDKKHGTNIVGSPDAATLAAMTPDFSKGTAALDEETGQPVVAREAAVAPPSGDAGGAIDALAGAKEEISGQAAPAVPAETRERDPATGRFVGEAAPEVQPAAAQPEAKPTGAEAAEAAAAQILDKPDEWAEYDEIEYTDPDTEKTYKFRTLKGQGDLAKRGFMRHADYTKKTMFLADARRDLEPLIADGRLKAISPLLRRALEDPEFGNFVVDAYNRRLAGQPLTQAQAAAADAVQATQPQRPAQAEIPALTPSEDPFMAQAMEQYMAPFKERIERAVTVAEQLSARDDAREAAERLQTQQTQHRINVMYSAHQELSRRYPDEFTGDIAKDNDRFQRAATYARESGFAQIYPDNPLAVVLAYEDQRRLREEAAASPAAAAIAQNQAAERKVAAANANAVPSGAPATNTTRKTIPPPPATRVNGIAVDAKEYARQQLARMAAAQQ
jgi:hypothetical protein